MILVALETSTLSGSVAVDTGRGRVLQGILPADRAASESLLPEVERLLSEADVRKDAVGGLAVGVGPGSFTGLRVGLATVKGWASAASLPIAAVVSTDAVAFPILRSGRPALVAVDARKGEVYAAAYEGLSRDGLPVRRGPIVLLAPESAADYLLRDAPKGAILVGTGTDLVGPFIPGYTQKKTESATDPYPRALSVLDLGRILIALGQATGPDGLRPFYVRPPDVHPSPGRGAG